MFSLENLENTTVHQIQYPSGSTFLQHLLKCVPKSIHIHLHNSFFCLIQFTFLFIMVMEKIIKLTDRIYAIIDNILMQVQKNTKYKKFNQYNK